MKRIDYTKRPPEVQRLDAQPVESGFDEHTKWSYVIVLERDLSEADKDKLKQAEIHGMPINILVEGVMRQFIPRETATPPFQGKWPARIFAEDES